jgi:hypothetical protein
MLVPENLLKLMSPEDRRLVAKGQLTAEQALDKFCRREEKELHRQFESWLMRHEVDYTHARMDKPSTIEVGTADYHVWRGIRHAFIEFKSEHGKLRKEQEEFVARQLRYGTPILVTKDYSVACAFVRSVLFIEPVAEP